MHRSARTLVQDRAPRHVKLNVLPCVWVRVVENVVVAVVETVPEVVVVVKTPVLLAVRRHVRIVQVSAKVNVVDLA